MRKIKWGVNNEPKVLVEKEIPAGYCRLISQLSAEITHAALHSGHEALRRCSYAMEVLDAFGTELSSVRSMNADFRSKVLTPILQRQLRGVPDHYTPGVSCAIASDGKVVTIADATEFYLREDPLDPKWIPSYRRNLIYTPEMRWHLGVILGIATVGNEEDYNDVRSRHDLLMKALKTQTDDHDHTTFSATEVFVLVEEELEGYFEDELEASV